MLPSPLEALQEAYIEYDLDTLELSDTDSDDGGAPPSSPGSDGGVGGCGACTFALRKTLQAGVCFSASAIDIGLCPWPIFLM